MNTYTKNIVTIIIALGIFVIGDNIASAIWSQPTSAPPGGNVAVPVHTGTQTQDKPGWLTLDSIGTRGTALFATSGGNVGIGTTDLDSTPSIKNLLLRAVGKIGATEYCDENGLNCVAPPFGDNLDFVRVKIPWQPINTYQTYTVSCPAGYIGAVCAFDYYDTNYGIIYHGYASGTWNADRTSCSITPDDTGISEGELVAECARGGSGSGGGSGGPDNDWTISGNNMYSNVSGNVGIGTTDPRAKLDVQSGDIQLSGAYGLDWENDPWGGAGDDAWIKYVQDGTGEDTEFQIGVANDGNDNIAFYQGGAERMTIYNGNVGIGTTDPNYKLDVAGTIRAKDIFGAGGQNLIVGDDTYLTDVDQANVLGIYGVQNADRAGIKLGSDGSLIFGDNGRVGIGTTNPGQRLDVSGNIHATGDICTDQGGGKCLSTSPAAGFSCPAGQSVTGFDGSGAPVCKAIAGGIGQVQMFENVSCTRNGSTSVSCGAGLRLISCYGNPGDQEEGWEGWRVIPNFTNNSCTMNIERGAACSGGDATRARIQAYCAPPA